MTKAEGRPRGRRHGVSSLAAANEDRGRGILDCYRCGRLIRDHTGLVCDEPLTKKRIAAMEAAKKDRANASR